MAVAASTIDEIISLLGDRDVRPWRIPDPPDGFGDAVYSSGAGTHAFEVCMAPVTRRPTIGDVRTVWGRRHAGRANPLLLICPFATAGGTHAHVCGPETTDPRAVADVDFEHALRLGLAALDQPDRHAAVELLRDHPIAPADEAALPGVRNSGMFAEHELRMGAPTRADWAHACEAGRQLRGKEGRALIEGLNFEIETLTAAASVLRIADGRARAVAVFLDRTETPEGTGGRFGDVSAVSYALAQADREDLPFVVLMRATEIRLYAASRFAGVGRKGRAETFFGLDLNLLPDEIVGYLPLIFSADALAPEGSFEQLLARSREFAADLSIRLRERVYNEVVPRLAIAVARHSDSRDEEPDLDALYKQTLVLLFRMLFLAYSEDRDLLPLHSNEGYRRASLKTIAQELADLRSAGRGYEGAHSTSLWSRLTSLFEAIDRGNPGWDVPAYNGGLFSAEGGADDVGPALAALVLPDDELAEALAALLIEEADEDVWGPVDFRALSVRDFGTIYEGLLESSLSIAPFDLTVDDDGRFVGADDDDAIAVAKGEIYHHNRSGERKATGSYFTQEFAVEHLLRTALNPALDDHLAGIGRLLAAGDDIAAHQSFFGFRCADIAMGSGHFLVAAIDHIEERMSSFLAEHPVPGVMNELARLEAAAANELHDATREVETATLLRRQIARRCVYGVDRNEIAVELARLSVWIHTFVPGLPLSFLNHNLVVGDSLTGMATISEVADFLEEESNAPNGTISLFADQIESWLSEAQDDLRRLGNASDATLPELEEARAAHNEAMKKVQPVRDLFDLVCAMRRDEAIAFEAGLNSDAIASHPQLQEARDTGARYAALHFPVSFPEVFIGDRAGFHVIVGNPPWDKVKFEPQQFWVTRDPGFNALGPAARDARMRELRRLHPADADLEEREKAEREAYQHTIAASYVHQGVGHYDFAKLFLERALGLLASSGRLGYVLPRQSLVLAGWAKLRKLVLDAARMDAVQARNRGGWLFENVHHSYMVLLLTRHPATEDDPRHGGAQVFAAVTSPDQIVALDSEDAYVLTAEDLEALSDSRAIPWFNSHAEVELFDQLRTGSRLNSGDGWVTAIHDARWDFRGTGPHRNFASRDDEQGSWRILMTRHVKAYQIDRQIAYQSFLVDHEGLSERGAGIGFRNARPYLTDDHPTIVLRHPSRNDDARTLIAAALQQAGEIHNKGYVHAVSTEPGTELQDLLALLCFLNTYCCDWWSRRFVDRHITSPVVNNLRLPQWDETQRERAAGIASTLLVRRGTDRLPGRHTIVELPQHADLTDDDLLTEAEGLAAEGFGLSASHIRVLLDDFSDNGCPPSLRARIIERVG